MWGDSNLVARFSKVAGFRSWAWRARTAVPLPAAEVFHALRWACGEKLGEGKFCIARQGVGPSPHPSPRNEIWEDEKCTAGERKSALRLLPSDLKASGGKKAPNNGFWVLGKEKRGTTPGSSVCF